ncbi:response regulator transcription factor, partial [bacterium]
ATLITQLIPESIDLLVIAGEEVPPIEFVNYLERNSIKSGILIRDDVDFNLGFALQSPHPIGLLTFDTPPPVFLAALKTVSAGNHVLPASGPLRNGRDWETEPLSRRELEVLTLLVSGLSNQQISTTLHISQNTVKYLLTNIYLKMGVARRSEAIHAAISSGLVAL